MDNYNNQTVISASKDSMATFAGSIAALIPAGRYLQEQIV
jgi:hypothetical protein